MGGPLALHSLVVLGCAALFGMYIAARRRLLTAHTEQARGDERARLAAEIHDIVAHRVSLMVLQAGALRLTTTDEPTRQAAEEMRTTGCQALAELRDLVAVLRNGTADTPEAPPPAIAELTEGFPAELHEDGDPTVLSPVIGRTAHRIVREALTNVRKHAPGAHTVVEIRYRPGGVRVVMHNTAATRTPDVALVNTGSGTGLLGLHHRVELVDGTLTAGPDGEGGFVVTATMPADVPTRTHR